MCFVHLIRVWSNRAWDDYLYWQIQKKINELVKDIEHNCFNYISHPKPLKYRKDFRYTPSINI